LLTRILFLPHLTTFCFAPAGHPATCGRFCQSRFSNDVAVTLDCISGTWWKEAGPRGLKSVLPAFFRMRKLHCSDQGTTGLREERIIWAELYHSSIRNINLRYASSVNKLLLKLGPVCLWNSPCLKFYLKFSIFCI